MSRAFDALLPSQTIQGCLAHQLSSSVSVSHNANQRPVGMRRCEQDDAHFVGADTVMPCVS